MKPQHVYTYFLILTLAILTGCASTPGEGPQITDPDREFFTQQAVVRTLNNSSAEKVDAKVEAFQKLANALDVVSEGENATGLVLDVALEAVAGDDKLAPEDKAVIEYMAKRIMQEFQTDVTLPLSDEQRRIIGVYSTAIKDGILLWQGSQ